MTINIALLRAINVGGSKPVAMAALRDCLTGLGLENVQSLLQTGNVVFESDAIAGAELERRLEAGAKQRLGLDTEFFVRSAREWRALVERNPFPREARRDPAHLLVVFFKEAPAARDVKALQAAITGREVVRAIGRQGYIVYPDGIGRSRVTLAFVERRLGTRGTGRNWNTVLKLGALA